MKNTLRIILEGIKYKIDEIVARIPKKLSELENDITIPADTIEWENNDWYTAFEGTLHFSSDSSGLGTYGEDWGITFVEGNTYKVTIGDKTKEVVVKKNQQIGFNMIYSLGFEVQIDDYLLQIGQNDYTGKIAVYDANLNYDKLLYEDLHIKLETFKGYATIPEEVIPDSIARVEDIPEGFSGSWNDLEDRPFYEMVDENTELIIEGDYTFSSAGGGRPAMFQAMYPNALLEVGEQYTVTIDSIAYSVVAENSGNIGFTIDIGSSQIRIYNGSYYLEVYDVNYGTLSNKAVHMKIEKSSAFIQTIDEKFIPSSIARVEDIPTKTSQLTNDSNYVTKATTLAGYGITDGASKTDLVKVEESIDILEDTKLNKPSDSEIDHMLVVKSVDSNGRVSEVKSVERTHGDFEEFVKSNRQNNFTISFSNTATPRFTTYMASLFLQAGYYAFIIDGKEYIAYVDWVDYNGSNYMGAYVETDETTLFICNYGEEMLVEEVDNDVMRGRSVSFKSYEATKTSYTKQLDEKYIPDTIARVEDIPEVSEQVQSDWNQNDETSPDYVKNRPFWFDEEEVDILPETTLTVAENGIAMFETNVTLSVGQTCTVTYNGEAYECVANEYVEEEGMSGISLGNIGALTGENITEEPFVIILIGVLNVAAPLDGNESFTLSISGGNRNYHKIPNEYLPKFAVNIVDGINSGSVRSINSCEENSDYWLGVDAIALGRNTKASGDCSYAEGDSSHASSMYSHAEGNLTTASGLSSHAEGYQTTASGNNQHVQGKYNVEDIENNYAHIVGNGIPDRKRSNAHTVDWQGNAWYSGDVYVGSTSGVNKDEGSKKLATEEYVSEYVSEYIEATRSLTLVTVTHNDEGVYSSSMDFDEISDSLSKGKCIYCVESIAFYGTALYQFERLYDEWEYNEYDESVSISKMSFVCCVHRRNNEIEKHTLIFARNSDTEETSFSKTVENLTRRNNVTILSPNGTPFSITVGDDGVLTATEITE